MSSKTSPKYSGEDKKQSSSGQHGAGAPAAAGASAARQRTQSNHSDAGSAANRDRDQRRASFTSADFRDSTAEDQLLENIEGRRGHGRAASGEVFHTAVPGERPLLGTNVSFNKMYNVYGSESSPTSAGGMGGGLGSGAETSPLASSEHKKPPRLSTVAKKIMMKRQIIKALQPQRMHKRGNSTAHVLLESIQETTSSSTGAFLDLDNTEEVAAAAAAAPQSPSRNDSDFFAGVGENAKDQGRSSFAVDNTDTDRLIAGAMQVEKLFEDDTSLGSDSVLTPSGSCDNLPSRLGDPLIGSGGNNNNSGPNQQHYGSTVRDMRRARRHSRRLWRKVARCYTECFRPVRNLRRIVGVFEAAYFLWLSLPLFASAWILYYYFGNPELDFMPGNATISWWLNFLGRHMITLELARATEWLMIDCFALGSRFTVRLFGPFLTLLAIQGKGWPFTLASWGVWNLFLLHGNGTFQTHWLYWTGLEIYSQGNSGSYILSSDLYLRVLLAMLMSGVAASVKRTVVAVYFGRRTFAEFKPRLEKILKDVVLLSEVADLAEEADSLTRDDNFIRPETNKPSMASVTWLNDSDDPDKNDFDKTSSHNRDGNEDDSESETIEEPSAFKPANRHNSVRPDLSRSSSGSFRVKDLLDRWEEPINKLDKTADASIHDILKFRRALSYMDESNPFGDSFGPARTRNECIESSHSVYYRLLKLTPDAPILSNDILFMLAQREDGSENPSKKLALKKLFRPDRYNQLPLLAFLQSIDTLYKKLRYFRASVGNASVIDHVLEGMIDYAFKFVLSLVILSLLNFNPWPLLVSMSTLLVSFSFAMGSSASKYIEGILLIAVRRPYDLGDRIVMSSADSLVNPGPAESWFVEDLNLYSTTLRYGQSNEVATVSNGTISGSRIVNCNRSPNAVVVFDIILHICLIEDEKSQMYVSAVEQFVQEHPRIWECVVFFRYERFDADNEQVFSRMAVRHRNSWQDAGRILRDKGELQKFIYELGRSMNVNFETPPARRLIYTGGMLKSGQVQTYKKNLLTPTNIHNNIIGDEPTGSTTTKEVSDALFKANLQAVM